MLRTAALCYAILLFAPQITSWTVFRVAVSRSSESRRCYHKMCSTQTTVPQWSPWRPVMNQQLRAESKRKPVWFLVSIPVLLTRASAYRDRHCTYRRIPFGLHSPFKAPCSNSSEIIILVKEIVVLFLTVIVNRYLVNLWVLYGSLLVRNWLWDV